MVTAQIDQKVHVTISSSAPAFAAQRQDLFHDLNTIDNLNVPNTATLLNRNHAKVFLGVLLNGTGNIAVDYLHI